MVYIFNLWFFIIKESTQERREASFGYASVLETEAPREQMTFFCLSSGERDPVVALLEREAEAYNQSNPFGVELLMESYDGEQYNCEYSALPDSIVHGVEDMDSGGRIEICGSFEENQLYLYVIDNGRGMSPLVSRLRLPKTGNVL